MNGVISSGPLDLSELSLDPDYDKGLVDIAEAFYLPCMDRCQNYDRIAGYFSSGIYILAWPALPSFVARGGRIRLICSAALSPDDAEAIRDGEAALEDGRLADRLIQQLSAMLEQPHLRQPSAVLAGLVAAGVVDVRVASLTGRASEADKRKFHDKVGIFYDQVGNQVGFRGSMNETYLGLAADGNLESIDVFPSWAGDRDVSRCRSAALRFQQIWDGDAPGVHLRPIPEVALEVFEKEARRAEWELAMEDLAVTSRSQQQTVRGSRLPKLREHQSAGLASWIANGGQGILKHATGSGKTITGLAVSNHVAADHIPTLVTVPSSLLLSQWSEEVRRHFPAAQILRCGDGSTSWRRGLLRKFLTTRWPEEGTGRYVLATLQTAADPDFLAQLQGLSNWLILSDEVHRMGSPSGQLIMNAIEPSFRLGLSATPERAGDPSGTAALLDFFGGIIDPPYGMREAMDAGVLSKYNYHPHAVPLEDHEQERWAELTLEIRRVLARSLSDSDTTMAGALSDPRLRRLLIRRASIIKGAAGKIPMAKHVLKERLNLGDKWLVYCDDVAQMLTLRDELATSGIVSLLYHSNMESDKVATLREFELNGGLLLSIRCLDEGVDIPSATHAMILASSKNPREFIQRRGRVLRTHKGKGAAAIHDAIVTPATSTGTDDQDRLLLGEMARAMEFAQFATNPQCVTDLERICLEAGLDFRDLVAVGEEDDEDGY